MSRYHPVRPKQQQHREVPQPAAPAQPAQPEAQARLEEAANEYYRAAIKRMYETSGGPEVDASIARCKRTLEQYDRELEIVAKEDGSKQHRWTISPSIAFRFDKHLHELMEYKEQLLAKCRDQAWPLRNRYLYEHGGQEAVNNSLFPPKLTQPASAKASADKSAGKPAAQVETQAVPAERMVATPAPIAA